jgi:sigma-B regulation protein RsbU (phosphoserine phosphatase)
MRAGLRELARKNAELATLYGRLEGLAGRMAEELRLAAHLQRSLLPPALQHPRLDVAREFLPFREIGGDYYDLIPLGHDRIAFAIGDVMGKGVPAALLAANLKACLRAQLQAGDASPAELVGKVNRLFWEVTPKGLFASLVFALFDFAQETLHYVNAGHDYPFLVRADGGVEDLIDGGTVLGLVEDSAYQHGQVRLGRGESIVFYSDGVTDRSNVLGEAYGAHRLKEAAVRSRGDGARLALYSLLGEVQGWAGGLAAEDDMTLVVAKLL